jgi:hypothetical protein
MRDTEARFWMLQTSSLTRALRFAAIALGVGLVMAAGPVRAADDEDEDDKTFEEKIIEGIMRGLGGTNMENRGIDYRERSPLVIPPTRDLPPPQEAGTAARNPAWPREPDRKVVVRSKPNLRATADDPGSESALSPDELRRGTNPRAPRVTDPSQNTGSLDEANIGRPMSPGQLNSTGIFNWNALMGTHLNEQATFSGEPKRGSLTQPPPGYQTPSPNYRYGAGTDRGSGWKIPNILDRPVGVEQ